MRNILKNIALIIVSILISAGIYLIMQTVINPGIIKPFHGTTLVLYIVLCGISGLVNGLLASEKG